MKKILLPLFAAPMIMLVSCDAKVNVDKPADKTTVVVPGGTTEKKTETNKVTTPAGTTTEKTTTETPK